MEQIIITHLDGTTLKLQSKQNVSKITQAKQTVELIGADTVDITVESASKLAFLIGDKITIIGRDYTLNTPAKERKISEAHFVYDMQFEGVQYDLLRCAFNVNVDTTSNEIQDINGNALTGDLKRFLDVLISNANRVFPGKWSLGSYPTGTETRNETFGDSDNCLSVLQSLCSAEKYNTEFKITIDGSGNRTLIVGSTGTIHTYTFEYGKGKGIFELTREKVSSSNIITRLYVYGSSKNINTSKYRADKLCLPTKSKSQSYIQDSAAVAKYGIWEGTKIFEEVYPHRTGTVSAPGSTILKFIDSSMDFDLNAKDGSSNSLYLLSGQSAKIKFNTGNLAGYEFDASYDHATKQFTLISQTDENGYTFPSPTSAAFQFAVGDKYVITNIYMPQSYIDTAESTLNTKGLDFYSKNSQPRVQYGLTVDSFYLKNTVGADAESNIIWAGDYIPIKDTDLDVDKSIRVKGFTRDLLKDYSYNLSISDLAIQVNIINRVISDINGIDKIIKINDLNDPAKARRNYLNAQEVLNMVFDVEGDFYTDKIKPASIDTIMLSVGAKSMQFGLVGTMLQPNYGGAKNRVVYTGGVITHYAILDESSNPRIWNITDGDITLATDAAYYIYVKCARSGTGASLLFSSSKIAVDSSGIYYHFLMGVINSVGGNNERAVALMYGFSTINGRFIKTGRIQSADGATYFDLDAGELRGNFKFTSGASVETAVTNAVNAAETAQATADGIKVGGRNMLKGSDYVTNTQAWAGLPSSAVDGVLRYVRYGYAWGFAQKLMLKPGTYTWSGMFRAVTGNTARLALSSGENFYINNIGTSWEFRSLTFVVAGTFDQAYPEYFVTNGGNVDFSRMKIEEGNKATSWTQAPEDTEFKISALDYLKTALSGSTDISGGLLATNVLLMKTIAGAITGGMSGLNNDNIGMWTGGTYQNAIDSIAKIILRKDGSGQLAGGKINWDAGGGMNVGLFSIFNNLLSSGNISLTSDSLENLADISGSTTTATPPAQAVASSSNGFITSTSSSNFTLSKNSLVQFRVSQVISVLAADYATCYVSIKNNSGTVVYSQNISKVATNSSSNTYDYSVNLPAGTYYMVLDVEMQGTESHARQTVSVTGYNGSGSVISIQPISALTKIANNGFYSYWGTGAYLYLRTDFGFQVMFGSYGIQCTVSGLQKTSNGGSSWTPL